MTCTVFPATSSTPPSPRAPVTYKLTSEKLMIYTVFPAAPPVPPSPRAPVTYKLTSEIAHDLYCFPRPLAPVLRNVLNYCKSNVERWWTDMRHTRACTSPSEGSDQARPAHRPRHGLGPAVEKSTACLGRAPRVPGNI